jgi:hypothetical protein
MASFTIKTSKIQLPPHQTATCSKPRKLVDNAEHAKKNSVPMNNRSATTTGRIDLEKYEARRKEAMKLKEEVSSREF